MKHRQHLKPHRSLSISGALPSLLRHCTFAAIFATVAAIFATVAAASPLLHCLRRRTNQVEALGELQRRMQVEDHEASPTPQAIPQPFHLCRSAFAASSLHFRCDFRDRRCDFRDRRCSVAVKPLAVILKLTNVARKIDSRSNFAPSRKSICVFARVFACFSKIIGFSPISLGGRLIHSVQSL